MKKFIKLYKRFREKKGGSPRSGILHPVTRNTRFSGRGRQTAVVGGTSLQDCLQGFITVTLKKLNSSIDDVIKINLEVTQYKLKFNQNLWKAATEISIGFILTNINTNFTLNTSRSKDTI